MRKNKRKKKNNAKRKPANTVRRRREIKMVVVMAGLYICFALVCGRLAQLMMFSDTRVAEFAEKQSFHSVKLHMPRGAIYDRNMNELAVSVALRSVYANPRKIKNPGRTARRLASALEPGNSRERRRVSRKLARLFKRSRSKYFVWVRRKAPPDMYRRVKKAGIRGVGFVKESKRFYPNRGLAANITGFCGIDNQGLAGVEHRYDQVIRPVNRAGVVRKDALGRPISTPDFFGTGTMTSKPYGLVLTIDQRIQYVAEKALERKVVQTRARGGVAIVMDPVSGEILAMAERPKYNPNTYARYSPSSWKSQAVSSAVEPGSTFKVFVAAGALEEGLIRPDEVINCENGHYKVGGKVFREAHHRKLGLLTVEQVIAKSSNIGAIKIGEKLGPEQLIKYLKTFGFGVRSGIDLPGESPGVLRPVKAWSLTSLPSISFGQEVAVTPVQLATGFCIFANGGWLVRPQLAKAFTLDGKIVKKTEPAPRVRVLSGATVNAMKQIMTQVVENGTGKRAAVRGFSVAGKTGTAQKFDPATGTYSRTRNLSSFAGFFPVEDPRLVILVMIDEPEGIPWGGYVAGPVFSEIAERCARILRIPSSDTKIYEIDWSKMLQAGHSAQNQLRATEDQSQTKGVIGRILSAIASVNKLI